MVKVYASGDELLRENRELLNTNRYLSVFFLLDAPLLKQTDKVNYALKAVTEKDVLLAVKVEPYALLLFGAKGAVAELVDFLIDGGYEIKRILGEETVCEEAVRMLGAHGIAYYEALAMDFMEATEKTEPSSAEVETPSESDLPEILECLSNFTADCGLVDPVDAENVRRILGSFRILRVDGRIVSMARICASTEADRKIAAVYTRPEYRGRGYARKVVNTAKNEILDMGKAATLNVDKKNPISNRLYRSLGFVKRFSQGEYRRK